MAGDSLMNVTLAASKKKLLTNEPSHTAYLLSAQPNMAIMQLTAERIALAYVAISAKTRYSFCDPCAGQQCQPGPDRAIPPP